MTVHRKMRNGLPEIFYHKALLIELKDAALQCASEVQTTVFYNGIDIGNRYADIIVENKIILELKATSQLEDIHLAQALNYLELTEFEIGLLLNFGASSLQIRRLINQFKK
jgi:GxxExxY protein